MRSFHLLIALMSFVACASAQENPLDTIERRGEFFRLFDMNNDGTVTRDEITGPTASAQLVVGAKGSRLQLVLSTLYHVSQPIENVPYRVYKDLIRFVDKEGNRVAGKYASLVDVAVPYCLADYFREFRAVGTTPELFDKVPCGYDKDGKPKRFEFAQGTNFRHSDFFAAVVGSTVARDEGVEVGDQLDLTHGHSVGERHQQRFHVVGILKPTGTPNDRAVFVNMEGFFLLESHAKSVPDGSETERHKSQTGNTQPSKKVEPLPEEQREVTAILLVLKNPIHAPLLSAHINEGKFAQAVSPVAEVHRALSRDDHLSLFLELARAVGSSGGKLDGKDFSLGAKYREMILRAKAKEGR